MTDTKPGKRVVFLNRFYWPDAAATSQLLTDLAEDLAAYGWQVTVLAGRAPYALDGEPRPTMEVHNGVRIIRVWGSRLGNDNLPRRAIDYATYVLGAIAALLRLPGQGVTVAMTDPPMLAAVAVLAARLKGGKAVYWLQDLYPQLAGRLGAIGERTVLYRALMGVARWMHARCDLIIAVGAGLARSAVAAGARPERTVVVQNWTNTLEVTPVAREDNDFVREHGLSGHFVVLYSGNAGRGHSFEAVMEAARQLQHESGIVFLFVGSGKAVAGLRAFASREGLENVRFLGYVERSRLAMSLSSAGVSLVTERPDVAGLLVPSKTYSILASGRPIIYIGPADSDAAEIVRQSESGFVVEPGDATALVGLIERLRASPLEADALGQRGRCYVVARHDRRRATRQWGDVVKKMVDEHSA